MTGISVTQTVVIGGMREAARRPLVSAGAVVALALAVAVLRLAQVAGLALAWVVVVLLSVLALCSIGALIVYAMKSPERLPVWELVAPGVESTQDPRVVGRSRCAACPGPATTAVRWPAASLLFCSVHASAAGSYLRRALPGGAR